MNIIIGIFTSAWGLLLESAPYMLFGMVVAGLVKVYLSPHAIARHLGRGRFGSVVKAAVLGVPLPLCSCGVLPAAASLKKQGANNGAVTAFMISTPESGIDSMAITYALMDPVMTVARPVSAAATALAAGWAENAAKRPEDTALTPDLSCPVDGCCDGLDCPPEVHKHHHTRAQRLLAGLRYAFGELWGDLATWFLAGLLLAGVITALVPAEALQAHLGGGLGAMLLMLLIGVPLYICATASTPIAAALVLGGVSPGAALVFLLVGPATNMASLTVLTGMLGKRATAIYLGSIMVMAVAAGLLLDQVYAWLGLSARAVAGQAAELMPAWVQWACAAALLTLSVGPVWRSLRARFGGHGHDHGMTEGAGCSAGST